MKRFLVILAAVLLIAPLTAQEGLGSGPDFSATLLLGSDLLPSASDPTKLESWSKLGFQPDLSWGSSASA